MSTPAGREAAGASGSGARATSTPPDSDNRGSKLESTMTDVDNRVPGAPATPAAATTASARPHRAAADAAMKQIHTMQQKEHHHRETEPEERKQGGASATADSASGQMEDLGDFGSMRTRGDHAEETKSSLQQLGRTLTLRSATSKRKHPSAAASPSSARQRAAKKTKQSADDREDADQEDANEASEVEASEDEQEEPSSSSSDFSDDDPDDEDYGSKKKRKKSAPRRKKAKVSSKKASSSSAAAAASPAPKPVLKFAAPASLMDLLFFPGATLEQRISTLALAMRIIEEKNRGVADEHEKQHFDACISNPQTGNTFAMLAYRMMTSIHFHRRIFQPLQPFVEELTMLLTEHADLTATNHHGDTLLDLICRKETYGHRTKYTMSPSERYQAYLQAQAAQQQQQQQQQAGHAAAAAGHVFFHSKNPRFAERIIKCTVDALRARGSLKRGWLLQLAALATENIFPATQVLHLVVFAHKKMPGELHETDAGGTQVLLLLCDMRHAATDSPALLTAGMLLRHHRILADAPIFARNAQGMTIVDLIEKAAGRQCGTRADQEAHGWEWETPPEREQRLRWWKHRRAIASRVELTWLQLHKKKIVAMLQQHFIPDLATVIFDCLAGHHASHQQAEKEEMLEHQRLLEAEAPEEAPEEREEEPAIKDEIVSDDDNFSAARDGGAGDAAARWEAMQAEECLREQREAEEEAEEERKETAPAAASSSGPVPMDVDQEDIPIGRSMDKPKAPEEK